MADIKLVTDVVEVVLSFTVGEAGDFTNQLAVLLEATDKHENRQDGLGDAYRYLLAFNLKLTDATFSARSMPPRTLWRASHKSG